MRRTCRPEGHSAVYYAPFLTRTGATKGGCISIPTYVVVAFVAALSVAGSRVHLPAMPPKALSPCEGVAITQITVTGSELRFSAFVVFPWAPAITGISGKAQGHA